MGPFGGFGGGGMGMVPLKMTKPFSMAPARLEDRSTTAITNSITTNIIISTTNTTIISITTTIIITNIITS